MEYETGQRSLLAAKANYQLDSCFRADVFNLFRAAITTAAEVLRDCPTTDTGDGGVRMSANDVTALYNTMSHLLMETPKLCDSLEHLAFGTPFFTNLHEIRAEFDPREWRRAISFDPLGIDRELDPRIFESLGFYTPGFRRSPSVAS